MQIKLLMPVKAVLKSITLMSDYDQYSNVQMKRNS